MPRTATPSNATAQAKALVKAAAPLKSERVAKVAAQEATAAAEQLVDTLETLCDTVGDVGEPLAKRASSALEAIAGLRGAIGGASDLLPWTAIASAANTNALSPEQLARAAAAVEAILDSDIPGTVKQALENALHDASRVDTRLTRLWTAALSKATVSETRALSLATHSDDPVRLVGIRMLLQLAQANVVIERNALAGVLHEGLSSNEPDLVRAAVELAIVAQMPANERRDIAELARNVMTKSDGDGNTVEVLDPRRVAEIYRNAGAPISDIANFFKSCFGAISGLRQHLAAIEAVPTLSPDAEHTEAILDAAISAYAGSLGAICNIIDTLGLQQEQVDRYVSDALALALDPPKVLAERYGKTPEEAAAAGADIGTYVVEGLVSAIGRGALPPTLATTVFDALRQSSAAVQRQVLRVTPAMASKSPELAAAAETFIHNGIASSDPQVRSAAIFASRDFHGGELAESDVATLARDPQTASAIPLLLSTSKLDSAACKRLVDEAMKHGPEARTEIARRLDGITLAKADSTKLVATLMSDTDTSVILATLGNAKAAALIDPSSYTALLGSSDPAVRAAALAFAPISADERAKHFAKLCETERDPQVVQTLLNVVGAVPESEVAALVQIIEKCGSNPAPGTVSLWEPISRAGESMRLNATAAQRLHVGLGEQGEFAEVVQPTPATAAAGPSSVTTQEHLTRLHALFASGKAPAPQALRAHLKTTLMDASADTIREVLGKAIELEQTGRPSLSAIEARRRALDGYDFDPKTMVEVEGVWLQRNLETPSGPVPQLADEALIDCAKTRSNRRTVAEAWAMRVPLWLEGPSSAGKTAIIRELCAHTGSVFRRFNCNPYTDVQEMLGRMVPNADDPTNGHFEPGPIVQAMINGECLLLDEMDLASPTVRSRINGLLDSRGELTIQGFNGGKPFKPHPNFRIFACTNGTSVVGRQKSDPAFLDRWVRVPVEGLDKADITAICEHKFGAGIPAARLAEIIDFHMAMANAAETKLIGGREAEYSFTLRNMFRVCQRFVRYAGTSKDQHYQQVIMRREAEEVYLEGMIEPRDRSFVSDELGIRFSGATAADVVTSRGFKANPDMPGTVLVEAVEGGHKLGDAFLKRLDCCTENVPKFERPYIVTERVAKVLYQLFKAVENHENVLLVGEKGCGKTTIAQYLAHLRNQTFRDQVFDATSDPSTMIGNYGPMGWQDAFLTDAIRNKGIALADELNTAPPPVVERPNALLDGEKNFYVTEKSGKDVVTVPPEFMFIAAVNPATYQGRFRFSRALMNRLTVINVPSLDTAELKIMAAALGALEKVPRPLTDAMVDLQTWVNEGVANKTLATADTQAKTHALRSVEQFMTYLRTFVPMRSAQARQAGGAPPSRAEIQRRVFVDATDMVYRMTGAERQHVRERAQALINGSR